MPRATIQTTDRQSRKDRAGGEERFEERDGKRGFTATNVSEEVTGCR